MLGQGPQKGQIKNTGNAKNNHGPSEKGSCSEGVKPPGKKTASIAHISINSAPTMSSIQGLKHLVLAFMELSSPKPLTGPSIVAMFVFLA